MNDRSSGPRQRWQIRFSRKEPALRMRQADLLAEWERVFREAELPLSYSAALKPKPRVRLAANPPMGIELQGEIVEAYFDDLVPLDRMMAAGDLLTDGLSIEEAREVWHGFPSAASQLRGAEYELEVRGDGLTDESLRGAIVRLLASPTLIGMRHRGESERRSDAGKRDLRPLIEDVEVLSVDEKAHTGRLRLVLRLDATGAGRPEDVVAALDVPLRPSKAVRTRLLFVDTPPIAR